MARSNLNTVDSNTEHTQTAVTTELPSGETINDWYIRGARQAGLYVTDDGRVVGQTDGYAFIVPAPRSFEDVAAFFVYSLVKNGEYRIGQNGGGDLTAETTKFSEGLGTWKPARNADAGQAIFLREVENTIRARIVNSADENIGDTEGVTAKTLLLKDRDANGNTVMRVVDKKAAGVVTLAQAVELVAKANEGERDRIINEAIERGRNKPVEEKAAGPGRGRRASNAPDLGEFSLA